MLNENAIIAQAIEDGLQKCVGNWTRHEVPLDAIADAMISTGATIAVSTLGQEQTAQWFRDIADAIETGAIVRKPHSIN